MIIVEKSPDTSGVVLKEISLILTDYTSQFLSLQDFAELTTIVTFQVMMKYVKTY